MQVGAFWLFLVAVSFVAAGLSAMGNVILDAGARDAQVIADRTLDQGEGPAVTALAAEAQAGQTAWSVPASAPVPGCITSTACPYMVQVSYVVDGATTSGSGTTDEIGGELEEQPSIDEQLVGVHETAKVTSPQGATVAARSRRLTVRVSKMAAEVVARFDDAASSRTALAAQGLGGCDASSMQTYGQSCNSDAAQAGSDTRTHAILTCVDDPATYAHCNGATPRPDDQFVQPTWQDGGAAGDGFAR
ncbi:hypothetical protein EPN44_14200 [bacterium]|nr:MAG: hypothetical protein EPN44_14200 [bacterium]